MINSVEIRVFTYKGQGGNPCSVVLDASILNTNEMLALAKARGHECGFSLPDTLAKFDFQFRYFVPNHEMEMCGHPTLGLLWRLARTNLLQRKRTIISTNSGPVRSDILFDNKGPVVRISQPEGRVEKVTPDMTMDALSALNLDRYDFMDRPIQDATTSRTKTLVPLVSAKSLQSIRPDPEKIKLICNTLGTTGLYPYIILDLSEQKFEARQFPKDSGYTEDPATGIAAFALAYGLRDNGLTAAYSDKNNRGLTVFQGRSMGNLSKIKIEWRQSNDTPCWITGEINQAY